MPNASFQSRARSAAPDPELIRAVRSALSGVKGVTEVKMFGGIGFMLNRNLLVGASKRGLLLRVGRDQQSLALAQPSTRPMEMRGRVMEGYVYADPPLAPDAVRWWVEIASSYVRTLPPKTKAANRRPPKQKRT